MSEFKLGDEVVWKSQSAGTWKTKQGAVVCVVPAKKTIPTKFRPKGCGWPRKHVSYVVRVEGKLYWPRVSALKLADGMSPGSFVNQLSGSIRFAEELFYVQRTFEGTPLHDFSMFQEYVFLVKNSKGATCTDPSSAILMTVEQFEKSTFSNDDNFNLLPREAVNQSARTTVKTETLHRWLRDNK